MADTAAHLVDRVLPHAPYRQWVFTVPKPLRLVLARDPAWTGAWQRRFARKRGIRTPLTGVVTFVQRFGGLVNLNVHFHLIVPDGVFVEDGERLRFFSGRRTPVRTTLVYVSLVVSAVVAFIALRGIGSGMHAPSPAEHAVHFGSTTNVTPLEAFVHVLLAVAVIIVAAKLVGAVFKYVRQPPVMGEVVAGLMLGPSVLGRVWPEATAFLLPANVAPSLSGLAQMGVLLYMFLVGLELNPTMLRGRAVVTVAVSHASILVPFVLGVVLSLYTYPRFSSSDVPFGVFALFGGVALSVTAFPVLARILRDRNLQQSRLGTIALACAAVDDVTAWCLLAVLISIAQDSLTTTAITLSLVVVYVVVMLVVVRPFAQRWVARFEGREGITRSAMTFVFVGLLASAITTSAIGIHAIFGAFIFGAIIPHDSRLARQVTERLEDVVVVLLLPAFFAFTGMRTQIGLIEGGEAWLAVALIILVACVGKFGGAFLAARLTGVGTADSAILGALMNTRGLMELVVLNVGLDLHVLSPMLFSMFVIMAVITTLLTTPIVDVLASRSRLVTEKNRQGAAEPRRQ